MSLADVKLFLMFFFTMALGMICGRAFQKYIAPYLAKRYGSFAQRHMRKED